MILKVIQKRRSEPRKRRDLRRLLRYLFNPPASDADGQSRLVAPPKLHKLVLVSRPWGPGIRKAAEELTRQLDDRCRAACVGKPIPDHWFVHLVVAFAPAAKQALQSPPDKTSKYRWGSLHKNACGIAGDLLNSVGWTADRPSIFVVHGDKSHIHVHVVALVPTRGGSDWTIGKMPRGQQNTAAKRCAEAFNLPVGGEIRPGELLWWRSLHATSIRPSELGTDRRQIADETW